MRPEVDERAAAERWRRARAIFGAALERAPEERCVFVAAACGSDDALRREVASLLAAHEQGEHFLDVPLARLADLPGPTPGSGAPPPLAPDAGGPLRPPRVLNARYSIERPLGYGGMATVFLATDLRHPRSVAVKILRPEVAAPLGGARFLREIQITATLVHPHILPLYDSGEADGLLYYVMPYVEGETLRHHLKRTGRLPVGEALRIAREVADALAYAHGVVHRDVKPENILLSDGHAVVADFGIGQIAGDTLTGTGFVVGTDAYMSPEQGAGERTLDGRADIYSLGCVLYEMLTGRPPFEGDTSRAVRAKHQVEPPPPVRALRGDVPAAVERILDTALAKEPAQRFATARQMADVLARGEGTDAARPATAARHRPRITHRGAGTAVLTALVGGMLVWWLRIVGRPATAEAATLVTVAPFHVASASADLQHWKYDLPLLIAPQLDAAEPLRASSPAVGVGPQPEITDRSAAAALGRRTGAHYVVFGRVLPVGERAVRVDAEVVDVVREEVVSEVEASAAAAAGAPDRVLAQVSDSLSRALLASFGTEVPVAATRRAAFGCASSSWPAVVSYLRGEQYYRRTEWDSAVAWYEKAISLDSGCALAYHRIAVALSWQGTDNDSVVLAYRRSAGVHNHGLPPRDSLLVLADSLSAAVYGASNAPNVPATTYWAYVHRLIATLEEASREYPGDPEMWYALGEARYHFGWGPASTTERDIRAAFDDAIRQDSGFALAYLHPIELAFGAGGRDSAMPYIAGYLATNPSGVNADGVRLVVALADPRTARAAATLRQLSTDTVDVLVAARHLVDFWADSDETAVRLSRVIAQRLGADTLLMARCRRSPGPHIYLAQRLAYRGHLREAACVLGDSITRPAAGVFVELAALGGEPDTLVARVYEGWLRAWGPRREYALPWWAVRRDTAHLTEFVRRADSVLHAPSTDTVRREAAGYDLMAGGAYLALVRGDTAGALARFGALPRTQCFTCFDFNRLTEAELLAARDNLPAADRILREWRGPYAVPSEVRIAFERARVAERLGRSADALDGYRSVVRTWVRADVALQPTLTEALRGIRRLGSP